jgi:hypothetical protein
MSASEARQAVEAFFKGFNAHDQEAIRASLNFPHVRLASSTVRVWEQASDFQTPFDRLIAAEGWHHSGIDEINLIHEGPDKVHFDVRFSRYKEDGTRYAQHATIWVVTRSDGRWGVQARSSYAP